MLFHAHGRKSSRSVPARLADRSWRTDIAAYEHSAERKTSANKLNFGHVCARIFGAELGAKYSECGGHDDNEDDDLESHKSMVNKQMNRDREPGRVELRCLRLATLLMY